MRLVQRVKMNSRHAVLQQIAALFRGIFDAEFRRRGFVIADGVAAIYFNGVLIGSVGSGDLVGELALLDNGPRTATVVSLTPMRIYVLDPSEFASLFNQPEAGRWIASYLAHRLRVGGSSGTTRAVGVSIPVR